MTSDTEPLGTEIALLPVRADRRDIVELLRQSDELMAELYPAESNHMVDLGVLMQPNVTFLAAQMGETSVGCGALVRTAAGYAEIKRMFVAPSARGRGIGRKILEQLEEIARTEGLDVRLETGVRQPEAIGLYRSRGYLEIAPFGDYGPDPLSLFMEKRLS